MLVVDKVLMSRERRVSIMPSSHEVPHYDLVCLSILLPLDNFTVDNDRSSCTRALRGLRSRWDFLQVPNSKYTLTGRAAGIPRDAKAGHNGESSRITC